MDLDRNKKNRRLVSFAAISLIALTAAMSLLQVKYMKHQAEIDLYLENSTAFCSIPDIGSGFIPQGLSYLPDEDLILLTGYYGRGGSSPIYLVDRTRDYSKTLLMRTESGESFHGHAGGISVCGGRAYVAGSTAGCMYGFPLEGLLCAPDGSAQNAELRIGLKSDDDFIRVSFTAAEGPLLFAGEFHKDPLFYTHASHAVDTPVGRQKAYLFGFELSEDGAVQPRVVYSIPDKAQGACFEGGYLFLSQTDSLFSARILTYALDELRPAGTKTVLGAEVPLYILTEKTAVKSRRIPPMSEEILAVDGKLLILYESAANRYRIGKRFGLDRVMATPLDFFL